MSRASAWEKGPWSGSRYLCNKLVPVFRVGRATILLYFYNKYFTKFVDHDYTVLGRNSFTDIKNSIGALPQNEVPLPCIPSAEFIFLHIFHGIFFIFLRFIDVDTGPVDTD